MSFESPDGDSYTGDDERKRDSSRKREGKKEKKEKGYQVFEEEDSEEEQLVLADEIKSPSKTKKERLKPTFKFPVPVRKEKAKEKDDKKDKETKEEKEKKKEEKKKHKKEKKKIKHGPLDSAVEISEPSENENPIFGVPLAVAVERNKSHDGIELPAIVRECIDYIEECGLAREGIYRISGVKSKVQHLKDCYNRQQPVYLYEHEPNIVASLLKQFLRDLPEPVLTTSLMPKFEEASTIKNNKKKVEAFTRLIADLPTCNRLLLSWMIVHMTHVIDLAQENKMTLQNVSIVLSPTMQISHRVLNVLFSNVSTLFGDILLRKYVPPLKPAHSKWTLELPDNPSALEEELAKQESLLNQLHADLNSGRKDPVIEEQLWEVQRVVTQLKRKIKMAKKNVEMGERRRTNIDSKRLSTASIPSLSAPEELQLDLRPAPSAVNTTIVAAVVEKQPEEKEITGPETSQEAKREVKFVEITETATAPDVEEINKLEDRKELEQESKPEEVKTETAANVRDISDETEAVNTAEVKEVKVVEETNEVKAAEIINEELAVEAEKGTLSGDTVNELPQTNKTQEPLEDTSEEEKVAESVQRDELGVKETEQNNEVEQTEIRAEETISEHKEELKEVKNEDVKQVKETSVEAEVKQEPAKVEPPATEVKAKPKPTKMEYEYRKAPNPPFMSTALLQPMKAEIPKPRRVEEDVEALRENLRKSEELRELEEELLGQKRAKKKRDLEELPDDVDIDQLLEEEYALKLEEEELLAIADELKQKIATERSEMERLNQEIQELQYLRQDSDLEDLSSSSSSSDESEDEEDLQELVSQLIQENEELEMSNADLCQKIHEERMICLSVKLQIRLLQQKQLESSYG